MCLFEPGKLRKLYPEPVKVFPETVRCTFSSSYKSRKTIWNARDVSSYTLEEQLNKIEFKIWAQKDDDTAAINLSTYCLILFT